MPSCRKRGLSRQLDGANLAEAILTGARLDEASLRAAKLAAANLVEVTLRRANLEGANLNNAGLVDAVLREANLKGANLSEADLFGADLTGANLSGADLSESRLTRAILTGANSTAPISRVPDARRQRARLRAGEWHPVSESPAQNSRAFLGDGCQADPPGGDRPRRRRPVRLHHGRAGPHVYCRTPEAPSSPNCGRRGRRRPTTAATTRSPTMPPARAAEEWAGVPHHRISTRQRAARRARAAARQSGRRLRPRFDRGSPRHPGFHKTSFGRLRHRARRARSTR